MKALAAAMLLAATSHSAALAQPVQDARQAAQSAYEAGQYDESRAILVRMLGENPDDPDLLRRLAAVGSACDNRPASQRLIDRAHTLAPRDADIELARANILLWRGAIAEARVVADMVRLASPDYPGLSQFDRAAERAADNRRVQLRSVSVGVSVSQVDFRGGNRADWNVQRIGASVGQRQGALLSLNAEREDRGPVDTRLAGRFDFRSGEARLFVSGSVTPGANFREDWSLGAGGELPAGDATTILLDGRYARYRVADVGVVGAGIRQVIGPRLSLTGRSIHLFGGGKDYRLGGSLRADYESEQGPGFFALVASYPDTEANNTRQVRAVAGGVRFALGTNWVLRAAGEYENRADSYERLAAGIDLTWVLRAP